MIWLQLAELPQVSVAVQVRVMTLSQELPGRLWISEKTGVNAPAHPAAVASAGAGTSPRHSTPRVAVGQPERITPLGCAVTCASKFSPITSATVRLLAARYRDS